MKFDTYRQILQKLFRLRQSVNGALAAQMSCDDCNVRRKGRQESNQCILQESIAEGKACRGGPKSMNHRVDVTLVDAFGQGKDGEGLDVEFGKRHFVGC